MDAQSASKLIFFYPEGAFTIWKIAKNKMPMPCQKISLTNLFIIKDLL